MKESFLGVLGGKAWLVWPVFRRAGMLLGSVAELKKFHLTARMSTGATGCWRRAEGLTGLWSSYGSPWKAPASSKRRKSFLIRLSLSYYCRRRVDHVWFPTVYTKNGAGFDGRIIFENFCFRLSMYHSNFFEVPAIDEPILHFSMVFLFSSWRLESAALLPPPLRCQRYINSVYA